MNTNAMTAMAAILALLLAALGSSRPSRSSRLPEPSPIGVWDLEGAADADVRWIATLVLTGGETEGVVGHADWLSNRGSGGREHLIGTYDARNRVLEMHGTRIEYSDNVVRCTYRCELSPDGSRLQDGRWSDYDPAIPGSWSAKRIEAR